MIHKDQGRKERLEISRVSKSDEPNPLGFHRNTLLYYDEGRNKDSKHNQNKKMILVTLEDKFVCHTQVTMTSVTRRTVKYIQIKIHSTQDIDNMIPINLWTKPMLQCHSGLE